MNAPLQTVSYFPGCSLATSAKENNQSLKAVCAHLGYRTEEIKDWNCCGSSSAHSINTELAFQLACRNLSLAAPGRPLLVACPSCLLRLQTAQKRLQSNPADRADYEKRWGRPVDDGLRIVHFFELMDPDGFPRRQPVGTLNDIRFAPYYGCMLASPPELDSNRQHQGLMEKLLCSFGAQPVEWTFHSRCCGTFLSVARPDIVEPIITRIIQGAVEAGAECIVTACAMCHLNLEIRCSRKEKLPIFHFSELLALAFNMPVRKDWFARHLVDPMQLLKKRRLVA